MFCPKCGSENQDTNRFCKKCGAAFPDRGAKVGSAGSFDLLGQVIEGKYRIDVKLGSGGMGEVYRATRLLIGDSVAVKILHSHLARDAQAAERFRREAVTATRLRHRNVVALYDAGVSSAHNLPYLLMELAEGVSLRRLLHEDRTLSLDFVITVAAQVCSALGEAHQLGIVHRDIKPENIIANETTAGWQIKILDFGIAKLYNQADVGLTQDGTAMGTPQYMSPEQCLGDPIDGRSDIYSLGIVLYEMLCGVVPFKSATPSAVAVFQVQNPPPLLRSLNPDIDPGVEAVVLRSLSKQPDSRQQTALEFSQELVAAATSSFKSTLRTSPVTQPGSDGFPGFYAHTETAASDSIEASGVYAQEHRADPESSDPAGADDTVLNLPHTLEPTAVMQGGSSLQVPENEAVLVVDSDQNSATFEEFRGANNEQTETYLEFTSTEWLSRDDIKRVNGTPETSTAGGTLSSTQAETVVLETISSSGTDRPASRLLALLSGIAVTTVVILSVGGYLLLRTSRENGDSPSATRSAPDASTPAVPAGTAYVPGGEFIMGDDRGDEYSRPAHKVSVKPFFIDLTEVTNEEYKRFADATGRRTPPPWKSRIFPEAEARFPVTGVTWEDAKAFADWAGKRLPTEEEWEFAARGTDGRIYPWGDKWDAALANAGNSSRGLREVAQGGTSPFGLYDMSGNAWEWTSTDERPYPGGKSFYPSPHKRKIMRGGGWKTSPPEATAINRTVWGITGENDYSVSGFRCVKDFNAP